MKKALNFDTYIGMQYIMAGNVYNGYTDVRIEVLADDGTITEIESIPFGSYRVFIVPVSALNMVEVYTLTVHAQKDGKDVYNEIETTSVEMKTKESLPGFASKPASIKVLVDMLNYGAALQLAHGVNADNLPNDDLEAYAEYMTTEVPEMVDTNKTVGTGAVEPYRMAFGVKEVVYLQVIYKAADVAGCEARYKIGDNEEVVVKSEEFTDYAGYKLVLIAFKPAEMRTEFTVALYNSTTGEQVSAQTVATAQAYASTLLGGKYNDVAIEMMRYSDAVIAYIASK